MERDSRLDRKRGRAAARAVPESGVREAGDREQDERQVQLERFARAARDAKPEAAKQSENKVNIWIQVSGSRNALDAPHELVLVARCTLRRAEPSNVHQNHHVQVSASFQSRRRDCL